MLKTSLCLLSGCIAFYSVTAKPEHCDPDYECKFNYISQSKEIYRFDFSVLCSDTDYIGMDSQNHTYNFNVCGYANKECVPEWPNTFQYGVATQFFGDAPACNQSAPACVDPDTGDKMCCTAPCQVLGTGYPVFDVKDPQALDAGVTIQHFGVPPSIDDPFECPWDPKTGEAKSRSVTYHFTCNTLAVGELVNIKVEETAACEYLISAETDAACGCIPHCEEMNCGYDGCGGFCGECPYGSMCTEEQICCRPDCRDRTCGDDGCGGSCGKCLGNLVCDEHMMCIDNSTSPAPNLGPAPVNKGGAWAGGIFIGMLLAVIIAGGVFYLYRRRNGAWSYQPTERATEAGQTVTSYGT